ncbi:MAG: hypothetical protein VXW22_10580 [Pseudomonadota bacterium]|nr:hypothetical protein [Pseudomonadota bacterium]
MSEIQIDYQDLKRALNQQRRASYIRLQGGWPVAMAGFFYWAALGVYGVSASLYEWAMAAYMGSGLIFPVAVGLSQLAGRSLFGTRQLVGFVAVPAIIGMLLFWPIVVAAGHMQAYALIPLILAIGMGIHWPVIGWSYGRVLLYSMHAAVRGIAVLLIWMYLPEARLTLMPLAVAAIYGVTILAILIDVRAKSRGLRSTDDKQDPDRD